MESGNIVAHNNAVIIRKKYSREKGVYEIDVKDDIFVATLFVNKTQAKKLSVGESVIKLVDTGGNYIFGIIKSNGEIYYQNNSIVG